MLDVRCSFFSINLPQSPRRKNNLAYGVQPSPIPTTVESLLPPVLERDVDPVDGRGEFLREHLLRKVVVRQVEREPVDRQVSAWQELVGELFVVDARVVAPVFRVTTCE